MGAAIIRIDLVDKTASVKHVEFQVVPVTNGKDFANFVGRRPLAFPGRTIPA
jgi:hypothetical protein